MDITDILRIMVTWICSLLLLPWALAGPASVDRGIFSSEGCGKAKCKQGEGDCDSDDDCVKGLVCEFNWMGKDVCVTGTSSNLPDLESTTNPKCYPTNGVKFSIDCCTDESPCYDGEGGCLSDNQCAGDLVCGKGSCPEASDLCKWYVNGCSCCQPKPKTNPKCNPATWDKFSFDCCTEEKPCYEGEGQCKKDEQCAGDLVCGKDNCPAKFADALCYWHIDGCNCCQKNK